MRSAGLFFLIAVLISMAACGGPSPANNAGNANNANSNLAGNNANQKLTTTKSPEAPTLNNAPTLGPVAQAFYDALRRKDDAALRETMTAEYLKSIEADMKADNRKDLAAYVAETDYRPGQVIETRNEKIDGDKGVVELRGGAYKNWTPFYFAKENGKWKFTGGSPATENMPKGNSSK